MKRIGRYLVLAAAVLLAGCAPAKETAAPAAQAAQAQAAEIQEEGVYENPEGSVTGTTQAEAVTGSTQDAAAGNTSTEHAAVTQKAPNIVTIVIPTVYERVKTQK